MTSEALPAMGPPTEADKIQHILKGHGIKYSHINDQILVANPMEEKRAKAAIQVCFVDIKIDCLLMKRYNRLDRSGSSESINVKNPKQLRPSYQRHLLQSRGRQSTAAHAKKTSQNYVVSSLKWFLHLFRPLDHLSERQRALVETGMLKNPDDLSTFALSLCASLTILVAIN
jgi:hypothetical protein